MTEQQVNNRQNLCKRLKYTQHLKDKIMVDHTQEYESKYKETIQ